MKFLPRAALLSGFLLIATTSAASSDLPGQWYGTWVGDFPVGFWSSVEFPTGDNIEVFVIGAGEGQYFAVLNVPTLNLFDQPVPMFVAGSQVVLGNPAFAWGTIVGQSILGVAAIPNPAPPDFLFIDWQVSKASPIVPGPPENAQCQSLPEMYCIGSAEYCSELVQFDPAVGTGYIDYLVKDETWDNQYRSYIRRDYSQLIEYATARVECSSSDWDYGNDAPVGLGDMSTADGTAPTGFPGHSTHEDGNHVDVAYYQAYSTDNLLRPVCRHHNPPFDVFQCTASPFALDPWRTSLFMAFLAEHPLLRYILVDGEIFGSLSQAMDDLVSFGWISQELRDAIQMREQPEPFTFHHDHAHIALHVLEPIVSSFEIRPGTLNLNSKGRFVTGYLELMPGHHPADVDLYSLRLLIDGHTSLLADPDRWDIADENGNGVDELVLKFDRQAIAEVAGAGPWTMSIMANVDGHYFQSSDQLMIIAQ
jgi:hypothetical protein